MPCLGPRPKFDVEYGNNKVRVNDDWRMKIVYLGYPGLRNMERVAMKIKDGKYQLLYLAVPDLPFEHWYKVLGDLDAEGWYGHEPKDEAPRPVNTLRATCHVGDSRHARRRSRICFKELVKRAPCRELSLDLRSGNKPPMSTLHAERERESAPMCKCNIIAPLCREERAQLKCFPIVETQEIGMVRQRSFCDAEATSCTMLWNSVLGSTSFSRLEDSEPRRGVQQKDECMGDRRFSTTRSPAVYAGLQFPPIICTGIYSSGIEEEPPLVQNSFKDTIILCSKLYEKKIRSHFHFRMMLWTLAAMCIAYLILDVKVVQRYLNYNIFRMAGRHVVVKAQFASISQPVDSVNAIGIVLVVVIFFASQTGLAIAVLVTDRLWLNSIRVLIIALVIAAGCLVFEISLLKLISALKLTNKQIATRLELPSQQNIPKDSSTNRKSGNYSGRKSVEAFERKSLEIQEMKSNWKSTSKRYNQQKHDKDTIVRGENENPMENVTDILEKKTLEIQEMEKVRVGGIRVESMLQQQSSSQMKRSSIDAPSHVTTASHKTRCSDRPSCATTASKSCPTMGTGSTKSRHTEMASYVTTNSSKSYLNEKPKKNFSFRSTKSRRALQFGKTLRRLYFLIVVSPTIATVLVYGLILWFLDELDEGGSFSKKHESQAKSDYHAWDDAILWGPIIAVALLQYYSAVPLPTSLASWLKELLKCAAMETV
eukprot:jgi/Bigna1/91958/estExt_fgenesh1_pg.C_1360016